jgi:hypothetical protein
MTFNAPLWIRILAVSLLLSLHTACAPERAPGPLETGGTDASSLSDASSPADAGWDAATPDAGETPPDSGSSRSAVGGPCRSAADCASIVGVAYCFSEVDGEALGASAPGGYCTSRTCDEQSPSFSCGPGTICGNLTGAATGAFCEAACSTVADCRTGYDCVSGGCIPGRADAGTPEDAGPPADAGTPPSPDAGPPPTDAGPMSTDAGPCTETVCGSACVDTTNDPQNCGGCGQACGEFAICCNSQCFLKDEFCGACGYTCQSGWGCCGNFCEDFQNDYMNCGGCGIECGLFTCCMNGVCTIFGC